MNSASKITPFWNRIPKFFFYGFHPYTLILLGVLFVASYLFGGPLINIIFYVVILKYAAEVMQYTVDGQLSPPPLSAEVINENLELLFKLFIVYLCYFHALGYLLGIITPILAIPLITVAILLLPAVVISLVVTEEIAHALNPLNWFGIAMRIGWPYLIMFLFLILFSFVEFQLMAIIGARLPADFLLPFALVFDGYFMFVMFHLMGYVVMQYHEELGHDTPAGMEEEEAPHSHHISSRLDRFVDEGNTAAAIAEISSLIQDDPQNLEHRRKMYVFLMSNGEHERLQRYTPHYFGMLADDGRYEDAATVYLDSHERGDPFSPESAAHYLPVMQVLRRRRASKQAVLLAQGFHKRFPDNPHTPQLYLEMAKVLSEELQRDDLAKSTLGFVLKCFPESELTPQVTEYLGVLKKLASPAG